MKRFFWPALTIYSLLVVSCENEPAITKATLSGYWAMETALRDSRETTLLNDVYFRFEAGGAMETNLPNTGEGSSEFDLKDKVIIQKTSPPVEYSILAVTDSTLVLAMSYRNTPFEFHLKKSSPPVSEPEEEAEITQ